MTALESIGDARIIKKPFVGDELGQKVHAAIADSGTCTNANVLQLEQ
jgi:hypothetical protein